MNENMFGDIPIIRDASEELNRKSAPENKPVPETENDPKKLTRRGFMKSAAVLIAGAGLLSSDELLKSPIKESPDTKEQIEKLRQLHKKNNASSEIKKLRQDLQETQNQKDISEKDIESLKEIFRKQIETQDHITLDKKIKDAIYQYFLKVYAPGSIEYTTGLLPAIERMRPFLKEIKDVFRKNQVPEEFAYLSIAESNFKFDDVSEKGAVGPFQITEETAHLFGMSTAKYNDERLDPIKSAELCARHLLGNFERFGKNWIFAFLAYNADYANDYMKYVQKEEEAVPLEMKDITFISDGDKLEPIAKKFGTSVTLLKRANSIEDARGLQINQVLRIPQKRELSIEGFYAWLEIKINARIKEELESDFYIVQKGDTYAKIAKKYGMIPDVLRAKNPKVDENKLKVGQKLNIPKRYKNRPDVLLDVLSGFRENINYPEKLRAILKVMRDQGLDPDLKNISIKV